MIEGPRDKSSETDTAVTDLTGLALWSHLLPGGLYIAESLSSRYRADMLLVFAQFEPTPRESSM